jgi:hypothetical protein
MHRLLQAKNHQLMLWQPCGTWRTISKGVEASHLIERNQRLCSGSNVFGMKVHLDFLVQPATVLNLCILCVYCCKVGVVLHRATFTSSNEVKSGFSVKKNSHLFVSMCIWAVCPQGYGRQNLLRTVSCIRHSRTAEEDLVPCWIVSCWGM